MRDGADPTGTVAGDLGDLASGFSLGQQPNDLPVAALHWVFCLPIAGLDVFAILMGFHGDALVHLSSVSQYLISHDTRCQGWWIWLFDEREQTPVHRGEQTHAS